MEFIRTKINGGTINAIYNGGNYYFYSSWYGLVAIAARVTDKEFNLTVDSGAARGGCPREWERMAKRVINKSENKYIKCTVSYNVTHGDLSQTRLNISVNSFGRV